MAIHTTASSFNSAFSKLIKASEKKVEEVAKETATEIVQTLSNKSPIDTRRFKSNWNTSFNVVDTSTNEIFDSGSVGRAVSSLAMYEIGDKIFMTNSLHYAIKLEYGGSQQAPFGVSRVTAVEYPQILRRVVARVAK